MQTNSTITIFNRRLGSQRNDILIPTVIRSASWFYGRGLAKSQSAGQFAENEDSYSVRIPFGADTSGKTYVEPWEWRNLTDEQTEEHWTIQKDDIVVRGEMSGNRTDQTEIMSSADSFLVNSFANNTIRGSNGVKHWRIGGV